MTFSQSIRSVFSKYATFSGRASRSEYWFFVLFNFLISIAIYAVAFSSMPPMEVSMVSSPENYYLSIMDALPGWLYTVSMIYSLAVLLPSLAVSVRRLHDIGKGGGWIFINLVPVIGTIWYIILTVLPSQRGYNRFGAQPD